MRALALSMLSTFLLPSHAIDTVANLDVNKYIGRWYQLYGNEYTARTITRDGTCVAADYGLDQATGNITVINSSRIRTPTGELNTISGYAYGTNPSEPGKLKVHLGQVPVDGDYWVVGLGPDTYGPNGLYEWAIVSGPSAESLFVLVRDVPEFEKKFVDDVLEFVADLGFTGPSKEPQRIVQEGCLPFDPTTGGEKLKKQQKLDWYDFLASMSLGEVDGAASANDEDNIIDEDEEEGASWANFLANMQSGLGEDTWSLLPTVDALDVNRYTGRWYQAYASCTASTLLEQQGACVTADYAVKGTAITLVNTARARKVDGKIVKVKGKATVTNLSKPGQLTVHFDGAPDIVRAPYWIVALGDEDGDGPYPWAIVSDPLRAFLFVLVRDLDEFSGSKSERTVLAKLEKLGFTSAWNTPRKTVQEGCKYTVDPAAAAAAEEEEKAEQASEVAMKEKEEESSLSSVLGLRGGAAGFGFGGPLHASCKMTTVFPENNCDEVSDALVAAAERMMGFADCNGGNKCGYTVTLVGDGKIGLVHETSVKHYLDDLTFTFTDKEGGSCEAQAFSTSETWYAVLDNSVNYCNLHNLVDASGLGYTERDVSDDTCTQYSTADCERY